MIGVLLHTTGFESRRWKQYDSGCQADDGNNMTVGVVVEELDKRYESKNRHRLTSSSSGELPAEISLRICVDALSLP